MFTVHCLGRLVDSKARTRSAGCAAYMAPERINPPNPNKPDYDIRADVWSLGITLVELATGSFPYKDCKTEFEVLTKVIQDDPPCLPPNQGFSQEFRGFVHDCLLKNHKDRPKYKKLLEHPFIVKYRDMDVDVGSWYHSVSHHSGDPNKTPAADPAGRKSSLEQKPEPQSFKPQPSPRMVKSWRAAGASLPTQTEAEKSGPSQDTSSSFSRLKFYTSNSSHDSRRDEGLPTSPGQRYCDNPRLNEISNKTPHRYQESGPRYDTRYETRYNMDSSRLNGSLGRNNFTASYHGTAASNYLSRPSYISSRSHEESFGGSAAVKSPQSGRAAHYETNSPREFHPSSSSAATQRKYSFETLDGPRDYHHHHHYTPKGTRKFESGLSSEGHNARKFDHRGVESPRSAEKAGAEGGGVRQGQGLGGARKYPPLPVPEQSRGREQARESSRNFIPSSWKIGSWTLSSPINLRKFRTSSSDRTSTFDRNLRLQPGYRSLNERDKKFYTSSGKSDNL